MKKQTLGHQSNHVTKSKRVENLWKKLIRQETDLSDGTIAWMTKRILLLTEYMPYGCALIAYRKQNGDFYMGRGTLIHYEADFHRKYDIGRIQNHVVYWDIEQQGWRTFQIENFLEWRPMI
ncbi:SH3 beta-barrel fold-containing protein [Bacteroides cellulosilyticus]|uniref:SH3 beta-barrel fold-containing protein n=1 Tax=Bacteroides cellulosilyticus TaxID=246787 RepID=UPI0032BFBD70